MKKYLRFLFLALSITVASIVITTLILNLQSYSARAASFKVGLITGTDTLASKSISWISYQGLLHAEQELGVVGTVYTSTDPTDFVPNVHQCAMDGNDLCIGIGYLLSDAISQTAVLSPTVKFAILDSAYNSYLPNLRGITFRSEEVGYLAGTLAALMSESMVIGDLGGMPIPPVTAFTEGYRNGAQCANPEVTTIISYTNTFSDSIIGAEYAQEMISQGADVIFAAAGPAGDGAILTATQSGAWAIGVDTDEYITFFDNGMVPGADFLLTSAMKRYDNAVYNTISDVVDGNFTPGTVVEGLTTAGVGLAPYHETEEAIPLTTQKWLDWIERGIEAGVIETLNPDSPCLLEHQHYLPVLLK
jgi:basic membrane protein A and related proteins